MPATTIQIRAQDKTKQAFSAVQRSVSGLSKSFGSLKGSIAGLLGVAALGGLSKSLLTTADRIDKVSQQTGVATGDLQKFQFAASQSGVSTEGLNKSLQTLAKRAGEAQAEGGEMKAAFDRLNISLQNADGTSKNVTDLFYESAKAISLLESDTAKAAAANDLFGRSGVELLPLLNQGEAGVRKYGSSLEKAGGIMSDKFVKGAAKTNDAIDKTTRVLKVGFTNVLEALLPTIQGFAKTLSKFSRDFKAFSETHPTVTKLALAVTALAIAFAALGGPLTAIVAGVVLLITNWEKLTSLFEGFDSKVKKMGLKQLREEQDRLNKSVKNLEVPWFLKGSASEEVLLKKQSVKLKEQLKIIEKQIKALETKEKLVEETNKTLEDTNKLTKDTVKLRGWLRPLQEDSLDLYEKERGQAEFILAEKKAGLLTTEKQNKLYGAGLDEQFKKHGEITEELKKQRAESARITGIVLSGIQSSGAAAARFFDALNIQIKKVGDSFKMTFETNWVAIVAKLAMSSKKVMGIFDKVFSAAGNAVDSVFSFIDIGADNANKTLRNWLENQRKIAEKTVEWSQEILTVAGSILNVTQNEKALSAIQTDYLSKLAEASELNSTSLGHVASMKRDIDLLAHSVGILRTATIAFADTAKIFLDAVATEGFGDVQKQIFALLDQFSTGPMANYTTAISEAQTIISKADPLEDLENKLKFKLGFLGGFFKDFTGMEKVTLDNLDQFWEKLTLFSPEMAKNNKAIIDALLAKITSVKEAEGTLANLPGELTEAQKGLMIMLKDILKTSFEGGATTNQLINDANALANNFKDAGINIKDLIDYINRLTPKQHGGAVSAGRPYLVGEQGPEMFMPSRSGWITPNNALASGPDGVVVNIYDGTGQRISEFDSAIRVEINERASRYNEFSAMAA